MEQQIAEKINYSDYVRTVEDFPVEGVKFYDIAPLIGNGAVFGALIEEMAEPLRGKVANVVGFDARGFIFGGALACNLGVGFTMLRKPGKLPGRVEGAQYQLEYGANQLEIQEGTIRQNDRVVLIDDVIATGGTALAGIELVKKQGAQLVEFISLIDIPKLGGSQKIAASGVSPRVIMELGD